MPDKHAVLSASSSGRWTVCTPSAVLNHATGDKASEYAMQGTCAHSLAEYKAKKLLGIDVIDPSGELEYYDQEMDEATDGYAEFIDEILKKAKSECEDPAADVELQLDLSRWIPGGFGTADSVIAADHMLWITDLKYGTGIAVSAERNTQLMCYGLGALDVYDSIYDIETVMLNIYQPRRDNVSTWEISKDELLSWGQDVLIPAAKLASAGEGEFVAGDHCRFCRVRATCRKRAELNLEMARYEFRDPSMLEDDEIEDILTRSDELTSWASDVKDYAFRKAMEGKVWTHHKLVAGRSVRKFSDDTLAAQAVVNAGFDPYEKKLLGITAMTRMLGKTKFEEILGGLVTKPPGKPTLVPESDKRPAIEVSTPQEDFKEEK